MEPSFFQLYDGNSHVDTFRPALVSVIPMQGVLSASYTFWDNAKNIAANDLRLLDDEDDGPDDGDSNHESSDDEALVASLDADVPDDEDIYDVPTEVASLVNFNVTDDL